MLLECMHGNGNEKQVSSLTNDHAS